METLLLENDAWQMSAALVVNSEDKPELLVRKNQILN